MKTITCKQLSGLLLSVPALFLTSCGEDTAADLQDHPTTELLLRASEIADEISEICTDVNNGDLTEADAAEEINDLTQESEAIVGALALKAGAIAKCGANAKSPELQKAFQKFAEIGMSAAKVANGK